MNRTSKATIETDSDKALAVSVDQLDQANLVRVTFGISMTQVMSPEEFYKLAEVFAKAKDNLEKAQAAEKADAESKAAKSSIKAFRGELARHFKQAGGDKRVADFFRSEDRSSASGVLVVDAYRDVLQDEEERVARGTSFWTFHGVTAYDLFMNVMSAMNCPPSIAARTGAAQKTVDAMAGSRDWMN